MKDVLAFILGVVLVVVGAWLAGFDFNIRGREALILYVFSLYAGGSSIAIRRNLP